MSKRFEAPLAERGACKIVNYAKDKEKLDGKN